MEAGARLLSSRARSWTRTFGDGGADFSSSCASPTQDNAGPLLFTNGTTCAGSSTTVAHRPWHPARLLLVADRPVALCFFAHLAAPALKEYRHLVRVHSEQLSLFTWIVPQTAFPSPPIPNLSSTAARQVSSHFLQTPISSPTAQQHYDGTHGEREDHGRLQRRWRRRWTRAYHQPTRGSDRQRGRRPLLLGLHWNEAYCRHYVRFSSFSPRPGADCPSFAAPLPPLGSVRTFSSATRQSCQLTLPASVLFGCVFRDCETYFAWPPHRLELTTWLLADMIRESCPDSSPESSSSTRFRAFSFGFDATRAKVSDATELATLRFRDRLALPFSRRPTPVSTSSAASLELPSLSCLETGWVVAG